MSSSLPKCVILLYFPVNQYVEIINEHRHHIIENYFVNLELLTINC